MASVNTVILLGNLGRDPDTRYTPDNNLAICTLSLATTRRYKDSSGQVAEETEWHRVVLFGRQAEIAQQYLRKGSTVYIEGRLRTRKWTDKNGVDRYSTEVLCESMQFVGNRSQQGQGQGSYQPQGGADGGFESPRRAPAARPAAAPQPAAQPAAAPVTSADTLNEDDVPF